jgi:putative GTP pyrophosphokinase
MRLQDIGGSLPDPSRPLLQQSTSYFADYRDPEYHYDGLRVEMQIRTRHQHAWATAVETISTVIGHALKSSIGPDSWLRFFSITANAIAMMEHSPLVPDAPATRRALQAELEGCIDQLALLQQLALDVQYTGPARGQIFLLELDAQSGTLTTTGFRADELLWAQEKCAAAELRTKGNAAIQVVLVSVDSLLDLRNAHPNYYLDIEAFIDLIIKMTPKPIKHMFRMSEERMRGTYANIIANAITSK